MNWTTSIRNSTGDIALEIDLYDQWEQMETDHVTLFMLAGAFLHEQPTNNLTKQVHKCLGIRRRVA